MLGRRPALPGAAKCNWEESMTAPEADIPILAALKAKDREEVLSYARRRTFAPGDVVIREGDSSINLFIVLSGHARVEDATGGPSPELGPGSFFGELGIIEEHPRTATVTAVDALTCLLIPAWEFRSLLNEHPEMAVPMLRVLIARLHRLTPHEH
jgi:CRP/FNR family transcriptional regulator, cyclic AMP receptor protein